MAHSPPKICQGCRDLFRGSGTRCPTCQSKRQVEVQQRKTVTAQNRPWQELYSLPEWKRLKELVRSEESQCRNCGCDALVVDHIVPHRGDLNLMFDRNNLQILCGSCHGAKTAMEDGGFGNKRRTTT